MKSFKEFLEEAKKNDNRNQELLWFVLENKKLPYPQFNLPVGASCPSAGSCKTHAISVLKNILDTTPPKTIRQRDINIEDEELFTKLRKGKYWNETPNKKYTKKEVEEILKNTTWTLDEVKNLQYFACYAALAEYQYGSEGPSYTMRYHNLELLNKCISKTEMKNLIIDSIRNDTNVASSKIIRLHTSGDFFNQNYFDAWIYVARELPEIIFYCYTKSIKMLLKRKSQLPPNLRITASYGGKDDALIDKYNLKYCIVVDSVKMANDIGLPVAKDDSYAMSDSNESFAILMHGGGQKGSFLKYLLQINTELIYPKQNTLVHVPQEHEEFYDEINETTNLLKQFILLG